MCWMWSRSGCSPGAPAGDADGLDHVDAELADVDEEEEEEAEGAVAPAEKEEKEKKKRGASATGRAGDRLLRAASPSLYLKAP